MIPSVYLLTLTVGSDTSLFTFSSEHRAYTALARWCRRRWRERGHHVRDPLPANDHYAAVTYFKRTVDESYELDLMLADPDSISEGELAAPVGQR